MHDWKANFASSGLASMVFYPFWWVFLGGTAFSVFEQLLSRAPVPTPRNLTKSRVIYDMQVVIMVAPLLPLFLVLAKR